MDNEIIKDIEKSKNDEKIKILLDKYTEKYERDFIVNYIKIKTSFSETKDKKSFGVMSYFISTMALVISVKALLILFLISIVSLSVELSTKLSIESAMESLTKLLMTSMELSSTIALLSNVLLLIAIFILGLLIYLQFEHSRYEDILIAIEIDELTKKQNDNVNK